MHTFFKKTNQSIDPACLVKTADMYSLKNRKSAWLSLFLLAPWACQADELPNASTDYENNIDPSDVNPDAKDATPRTEPASDKKQEARKLTKKEQTEYLLNTYVNPNISDENVDEKTEEEKPPLSADNTEQKDGQKNPSKNANNSKNLPYTTVYGNPEQADTVIIIGTSLVCPPCHRLHSKKELPKLKAMAKKKNSSFALILRDYPLFPISMKLSAMVWACGDKNAEFLLHTLYNDEDMNALTNYDGNDDVFLDKLEAFIGTTRFADKLEAVKEARKIIEEDIKNKNLDTPIIKSRKKETIALDINGAPWAFIMERNKNAEKTEKNDQADGWSLNELDLGTLDSIIGKLKAKQKRFHWFRKANKIPAVPQSKSSM
jgi:hypothetical protein